MDKKLIILLVLAGLAQNSVAHLVVDYGLPEEDVACLSEIIVNQELTVLAKFDGFRPIFVLIEKLAAIFLDKLEDPVEDGASKIAEALVRVKDAIDYSLNSILIALGQDSCSAVEVARNETHANLDDAYATAAAALELAQCGNYSENRKEIEELEARVQEDLACLVSSVYNSVRTCIHTYDAATLAVIQAAQDGSGQALVNVVHAVFDAIKIYAAAVTIGIRDVSILIELGDLQSHALTALKADVEYKFSALKAIFIATRLGRIDIVGPLAANQFGLTVSYHRFSEGLEAVFKTIKAHLLIPALGLRDAGHADYSLLDAARAIAIAKFRAAREAFLTSVLGTHPDAVSAVSATLEGSGITSAGVVIAYFNAIIAAQDPNSDISEALATIEALRGTLFNEAPGVVDFYFKLNHNGETWDNSSEAEFEHLQNATLVYARDILNNVFNATVMLAKAFNSNKATLVDGEELLNTFVAAIDALGAFLLSIYAGGVVAIKADRQLVIID